MGCGFLKRSLIFAILLLPLFSSISGQSPTCSYTSFSGNKKYATCLTLSRLSCFLHFTYHASNGTTDIAFRATGVTVSNSGEWVAWALNPSGNGMSGSQSLVAYMSSSGAVEVYTSSIQSNSDSTQLSQSKLSFGVSNLMAESSSNQIIIYATVNLPSTTLQQVWQVGPLSGGSPTSHNMDSSHLKSMGHIDFTSGVASSSGGADSKTIKKNFHGVLNAMSWGILMPIGAIIARYLKVFKSADPSWFYMHVTCQCSAYIVGVAGWGMGQNLGNDSGLADVHGNIGMVLFGLATLQVLALLLRPKKDHKYRFYWNLYHWSIGYTVIVLSVINVYKGLIILDPGQVWKTVYTGVVVALGLVALVLEGWTWVVVLRRKNDKCEQDYNGYSGANGSGNGHDMRISQSSTV